MSFIQIESDSDFSYENLPYGIFSSQENVNLFEIINYFSFHIT